MSQTLDLLFLLVLVFLVYLMVTVHLKQTIKIYDDPMLSKIYNDLKKIYPEIDTKGISLYGANNTLTENKKRIFICLKKKNGEYYDYNTLLYISIHELAHVINDEYDTHESHGEKFNKLNVELLDKAHDMGLIDKNAEIKYDMCGVLKN